MDSGVGGHRKPGKCGINPPLSRGLVIKLYITNKVVHYNMKKGIPRLISFYSAFPKTRVRFRGLG